MTRFFSSGQYVWDVSAGPHAELRKLPPGPGDSQGGCNTNRKVKVSGVRCKVRCYAEMVIRFYSRSENISIIQDELEGTTITTFTRKKDTLLCNTGSVFWAQDIIFNLYLSLFFFSAWIKKSISFQFNENFNVEYGENETKGVLNYSCSRPKSNIIHCK